MSSSPLQPEFFTLVGIDLFLAMSLLTCLLDERFPWQLPYIYQLAALAGFGQLIIGREFMFSFGDYTRFLNSLMYLLVALANIIALNIYLGIAKKLMNHAKVFMLTVTFPALLLTAFFVSSYSDAAAYSITIMPQLSLETTVTIVVFGIFMAGLTAYVFFKPRWQRITLSATAAIAIATIYVLFNPLREELALTVTCFLIIGISIYMSIRVGRDNLKKN